MSTDSLLKQYAISLVVERSIRGNLSHYFRNISPALQCIPRDVALCYARYRAREGHWHYPNYGAVANSTYYSFMGVRGSRHKTCHLFPCCLQIQENTRRVLSPLVFVSEIPGGRPRAAQGLTGLTLI